MELKINNSIIQKNKQNHDELFSGNRNYVINAFWDEGKIPCTQVEEYKSYEKAELNRLSSLNAQMEAAAIGFDNVPVTTFFPAVAYMMSSAYGCPPKEQNDLLVTTPKYQ